MVCVRFCMCVCVCVCLMLIYVCLLCEGYCVSFFCEEVPECFYPEVFLKVVGCACFGGRLFMFICVMVMHRIRNDSLDQRRMKPTHRGVKSSTFLSNWAQME